MLTWVMWNCSSNKIFISFHNTIGHLLVSIDTTVGHFLHTSWLSLRASHHWTSDRDENTSRFSISNHWGFPHRTLTSQPYVISDSGMQRNGRQSFSDSYKWVEYLLGFSNDQEWVWSRVLFLHFQESVKPLDNWLHLSPQWTHIILNSSYNPLQALYTLGCIFCHAQESCFDINLLGTGKN